MLERVLAVFALIVQGGAFVSLPLVIGGSTFRSAVENPYNTAGVAISLACIGMLSLARIRQIGWLASKNLFPLLFVLLVVMSAIWSIHPDITIRRGIGYVLTVLIASYLAVRFDIDDAMRLLSWSFMLSAIGSLLFVAVLPQYGIMQVADLAGSWRGVFPHKNVLGPIMAVAVFTELYLLVNGGGRPRWRLALLGLFLGLVVLSGSATALLLSLFYVVGAAFYLLGRRNRLAAVGALTSCAFLLLMGLIVTWNDPAAVLGIFGKDMTLTGRTTLWSVVIEIIRERPLLGWGYRATWQLDDPATTFADDVTGNWGVTSSHNGFLEIALQLGLIGMILMTLIVGISLWRGFQCCRAGILPLGWFSLIFFLGALFAAQTMETLGQNQVIEWVVFNLLTFGCGLAWARSREAIPIANRVSGSSRITALRVPGAEW